MDLYLLVMYLYIGNRFGYSQWICTYLQWIRIRAMDSYIGNGFDMANGFVHGQWILCGQWICKWAIDSYTLATDLYTWAIVSSAKTTRPEIGQQILLVRWR